MISSCSLTPHSSSLIIRPMSPYIIWYKDLTIADVPKVGGKNAALGELIHELVPLGVPVPDGFAITAEAYNHFLDASEIRPNILEILKSLNIADVNDLAAKGAAVRELIEKAAMPQDLEAEIRAAYEDLVKQSGAPDVAVRSSATAEDLPGASFAGQQETYLNIVGADEVISATRKCFASLFTNRAISYRADKGFNNADVALSVGVQKMVRSDLAVSGVMFSIDTETGFDKVIAIEGSYGLGEMVVQGKVTPDSFLVFKPALEAGKPGILAHDIGTKQQKMIYAEQGMGGVIVAVPEEDRARYCLSDDEVHTLATYALAIEKHFSKKHNHYQPMDMEWAKDGKTGQLFIVQSRPETIHATEDKNIVVEYALTGKPTETIISGTAVGTKIAEGRVRVIRDVAHINEFQKGEILVTEITDPDWEPIMKIAAAIVTDKGGRTSHAAIVSRELGIPCIVGTETATALLKDGDEVTIDCSSGTKGLVYRGSVTFEKHEHRLDTVPTLKTKVMVNIGAPEESFKHHALPVQGVGLGRLEFIIMSHIRIHPNALLEYDTLKEEARSSEETAKVVAQIDEITRGYGNKADFYVDELAEGVGKIAAAFYPHDVIVRMSDFKTNEYRALIGGERYEPEEENPMIGWRGASRYYDPRFKDAFALEVKALMKVREEMGLDNIIPMIPFCRTLEEAEKVLAVMRAGGITQDKGHKVYVMCEIPSNVILASQFLDLFDGMSIGSNDLTQLVLGLDRDAGALAHIGNEQNEAVKKFIRQIIADAKARGKYIGVCGQAPSDYPEFAGFLVEQGIESISLTPDTVLKTLPIIAEKEKQH